MIYKILVALFAAFTMVALSACSSGAAAPVDGSSTTASSIVSSKSKSDDNSSDDDSTDNKSSDDKSSDDDSSDDKSSDDNSSDDQVCEADTSSDDNSSDDNSSDDNSSDDKSSDDNSSDDNSSDDNSSDDKSSDDDSSDDNSSDDKSSDDDSSDDNSSDDKSSDDDSSDDDCLPKLGDNLCEVSGSPQIMHFTFTGQACNPAANTQGFAFTCIDYGPIPEVARIEITGSNGTVLHNLFVAKGGNVTVDSGTGNVISPVTSVAIYEEFDILVQQFEFNSSCDLPIRQNAWFGGLQIDEFLYMDEPNGGGFPPL